MNTKFFVSCSKGLEYLLVDELLALGAEHATATMAGANVTGSLKDAQMAVLWSRLASRVLWPLAEFTCGDEEELYAGAAAVNWPDHFNQGQTLAVDARVSGTGITHGHFAELRVKDAVVDTLRQEAGWRPSVDVENPDVLLNLVLRKGRAVLSIDLGGGALHRRGWRLTQHEAPLKENLAAAVLMRAGWPQMYAQGGALLDPMCGSGTLLIEGALMAADVAPGLLRYGLRLPTRWIGFDDVHWGKLCEQARERESAGRAALKPVFVGRDRDAKAITATRENASRAGVAMALQLETGDIAKLSRQEWELGSVVCNPPYDERLSANEELYQQLGKALQETVPTWRAAILCGSDDLAYATGLRSSKRYQLFNGALECVLLCCDPVGAVRVPSTEPKALSEGATMVANRLRKNLRKLKRWRAQEQVSCFRIYDADLPEYAAAVDVYEEVEGEGRTFLHVQEYAAPAEIPENDVRRRLNELLAAVREVFAVSAEQVALKSRQRGKGGSKYGRMAQKNEFILVREHGALLQVNLWDYLDTGIFLDHRPLRGMMAAQSRGKRFLNLFSYTGVASVEAAVAGAASTTSVDLSGTYLQWCADNMGMNGKGGKEHKLIQADALAWLEAEQNTYDIIFCDPPTFSNSARAEDFDIQREYVRLLRACVARLSHGGVLYFSNNFRRFKLDEAAMAEFAHCEEITAQTIGVDFERNARIHRCWKITRQ